MSNWLLKTVLLLPAFAGLVYSQYMTGVIFEGQVIPPARFSRTSILRIAEKFVQVHQDGSFARLAIFSDAQFANRYGRKSLEVSAVHVLPFELPTSYDRWQRLYAEGGSVLKATAEILTRKGGAGARIRYSDGTVERVVLHGKDPFVVVANGQRCELLDYEFQASARKTPPGGPYQNIDLYLRSDAPLTEDLGVAITQQLLDFRAENALGIHIRNDAWFIEPTTFPIVWAFDARSIPPTREQYAASETMFCLWWQGRDISCSVSKPKPYVP
jgi:hypothetical protein